MATWVRLKRGSSPCNNNTLFRFGSSGRPSTWPFAYHECEDKLQGDPQHGEPLGPALLCVRIPGTDFDQDGDVPLFHYNIDKNVWITMKICQCNNPAIAALLFNANDEVRLQPHPRSSLAPGKPSLLLEIRRGPNAIQPPTPPSQTVAAGAAEGGAGDPAQPVERQIPDARLQGFFEEVESGMKLTPIPIYDLISGWREYNMPVQDAPIPAPSGNAVVFFSKNCHYKRDGLVMPKKECHYELRANENTVIIYSGTAANGMKRRTYWDKKKPDIVMVQYVAAGGRSHRRRRASAATVAAEEEEEDGEAAREAAGDDEPQNQAENNDGAQIFDPVVQQEQHEQQPHGAAVAEEAPQPAGTEDAGIALLDLAAGGNGRDAIAPPPHQNVQRRQVQERQPQNVARGAQGAGPSRQHTQLTPTSGSRPSADMQRVLGDIMSVARREAQAELNNKLKSAQKHAKAAEECAAAAATETAGLKRKLAEVQHKLEESDKKNKKLKRRLERTMKALQPDNSDEDEEPSSSSDDDEAVE